VAETRQSFYEQFGGRALQSQSSKAESQDPKSGQKGKGKAKSESRGKGPVDLAWFDLKRIAPSRSFISWQAVAGCLENGDAPQASGIFVIRRPELLNYKNWR